jgi:hypothetical protein
LLRRGSDELHRIPAGRPRTKEPCGVRRRAISLVALAVLLNPGYLHSLTICGQTLDRVRSAMPQARLATLELGLRRDVRLNADKAFATQAALVESTE